VSALLARVIWHIFMHAVVVHLFVDSVTLHVMVEGGLVYLCASESDFGKRQPYAFLNEVGIHTLFLILWYIVFINVTEIVAVTFSVIKLELRIYLHAKVCVTENFK